MNRWLWTLPLAMSLTLGACRSAAPATEPAGRKTSDPGTPAGAISSPAPPASAVTPTPVPPPQPTAQPPAASVPLALPSPPSGPRPHQEILKLKQAGASDEALLEKIRSENVNYQLTTREILQLRAAGLSQAVVEAMLRSGRPR